METLLLAVALGVVGCASRAGSNAQRPITAPPPQSSPKLTGWREAFRLGIAELNKQGFRADEVKCRLTMWRDDEDKVWRLQVVRVPRSIGEITVIITDHGQTELHVGF